MPGTKVELSKNELELVVNREFILTKNRIIEKVYKLFGMLSEDYKTLITAFNDSLPAEVISSIPKIYRGENYLSLPYVMMDYPRVFFKDDVFAIRSFFWWGNYFSITLQLSGKYLQQFNNKLILYMNDKPDENYFVCISQSPWQHHFEESNYEPLHSINIEAVMSRPFFKIAAKLRLNDWDDAENFFRKNYATLLQMLTD